MSERPPTETTTTLADRRVTDNTELVSITMAYAKAMRDDPTIWAIFQRATDEDEFTDDEVDQLDAFKVQHFSALGRPKPIDSSMATPLLRLLAAGEIKDLDSEEALAYLKSQCRFD